MKWNKPLTGKQLVYILIVTGIVVALILNGIHQNHAYHHDVNVANCLLDGHTAAVCR